MPSSGLYRNCIHMGSKTPTKIKWKEINATTVICFLANLKSCPLMWGFMGPGSLTHGFYFPVGDQNRWKRSLSVVTDRQDKTRPLIHEVSRDYYSRTREDQTRWNLAGQCNLYLSQFSGFYSCDTTLTNNDLGRNGFIWLPFPCHRPPLRDSRAGTQCGNLEAGAEAEATGSTAYLLAPLGF